MLVSLWAYCLYYIRIQKSSYFEYIACRFYMNLLLFKKVSTEKGYFISINYNKKIYFTQSNNQIFVFSIINARDRLRTHACRINFTMKHNVLNQRLFRCSNITGFVWSLDQRFIAWCKRYAINCSKRGMQLIVCNFFYLSQLLACNFCVSCKHLCRLIIFCLPKK